MQKGKNHPARTKYHHGDLRQKLLETALQIISEEGLENITMRKLGQRLGVSRTAPYRHFSDKSALLCALAEEGYRGLTGKFNAINNRLSDSPLIRLKKIGAAYIEFALSNPVHYRLMFGNEILKDNRSAALVELVGEAFNNVLAPIEACQAEHLIRPINPYLIANALWSLTHGISTLLNDGQIESANAFKGLPALTQTTWKSGQADIDHIFDHIADILMNGFIQPDQDVHP